MAIALGTPEVDGLSEVVGALREWQRDGSPQQLHPGDLGWYWRFGAEVTASVVRTWSTPGRILAVGLLDEPTVLRLTLAPDVRRDLELARRLVEDLTQPGRGVLPAGEVYLDAPSDAVVRDLLFQLGWTAAEAWTPLRRDLSGPVPEPGARIELAGPEHVPARTAVQRAAFERSTFTDERWRTMAAGLPYADGRCLVAYDEQDSAVAAVTVWSAGPGRPGLIEPMGVHPDHRRQGHGRAITLAAAAALRDVGSSSVVVCTPSSNVGGVAAYVAAGFERLPEIHDVGRSA